MNRTCIETDGQRGRPRRGAALLQGLALCGRCGRRVHTQYKSDRDPVYICRSSSDVGQATGGMCWSTPGSRIDEAVERHVLDQITADNLDLSLQVLLHIEEEEKAANRGWGLRLERARQDAARAERQFHLVEPENRLVARTLERRWEEKLAELAELESAFGQVEQQPRLTLTVEQRSRILQLARNLPAVWSAPTTRQEDRKELLSLLVKQVALVPEEVPHRRTRVRLLWHRGSTTEIVVERPDVVLTPDEVLEQIRSLIADHTDAQIATLLDGRGVRTARGRRFDEIAVMNARHANGIIRRDKDKRAAGRLSPREDGRYSAGGLAHLVGVHPGTIKAWRLQGRLVGAQDSDGGAWWYEATPELVDHLRSTLRRRSQPAKPEDTSGRS